MRVALMVSALAALASAFPYPQEEDPTDDPEQPSIPTPTTALPLSTSLNIPITGLPTSLPAFATPTTTHKNPHWEPIPVFSQRCQCELATARYPCWATDALQRCHFEENFSYGCYMSAAGGCPTPTRVCSQLFQPTPRPGPHPCELGPNPPLTTSPPDPVLTSLPALPTTFSASLSVVKPSFNVSLPVVGPTGTGTLPVSVGV